MDRNVINQGFFLEIRDSSKDSLQNFTRVQATPSVTVSISWSDAGMVGRSVHLWYTYGCNGTVDFRSKASRDTNNIHLLSSHL